MARTLYTRENRAGIEEIIWPWEKEAWRGFLSVIKKAALLPLQALWLLIFTFLLLGPVWLFIIWLFLS